jgi:type IV pilus assembly protein PilX
MKRTPLSAKHARGSSLLIAMMFMLVMAMLGIAIANVSILEERMAGNTRDRDLAFQSAEAALGAAEAGLQDPTIRASATPLDRRISTAANSSAYWETCFTGTAAPCSSANRHTPITPLPTSGNGAVFGQPEYILERVDFPVPTGTTLVYRVTARGRGGTANSIVILQAEYDYTP